MSQKYIVRDSAINTRKQAQSIVDAATEQDCRKLDLSKVEFISRSSADELRVLAENEGMSIIGTSGDVEGMFNIIESHKEAAV